MGQPARCPGVLRADRDHRRVEPAASGNPSERREGLRAVRHGAADHRRHRGGRAVSRSQPRPSGGLANTDLRGNAHDHVLSQSTPGIAGVAEGSEQFSFRFTAVDLEDSRVELAAGVLLENGARGGACDGRVLVFYGSSTGLRPHFSQVFTQRRVDLARVVACGVEFGRALADTRRHLRRD